MKPKPVAPACPVLVGRYISPEILAKIAADAATYVANLSKNKGKSCHSYAKLLEQYYTRGHVVQILWAVLRYHVDLSKYLIFDPCAGNAVFARNSEHDVISIDVDPQHSTVIKANFLAVTVQDSSPIAVIGNPPFKLAKKFFNHAAKMAKVIAMIFPASFLQDAMQTSLNKHFHCVYQFLLPPHSFVHNGKASDIPAVFQIWIWKNEVRVAPKPKPKIHPDFLFTKSKDADFAIRRIGGRAGEIHCRDKQVGTSYLYVKATDRARPQKVKAVFETLDLTGIAKGNGEYPSISMSKIVALYNGALSRSHGCHVSAGSSYSRPCRNQPVLAKGRGRAISLTASKRPRRVEAFSQCIALDPSHSSFCSGTMSVAR